MSNERTTPVAKEASQTRLSGNVKIRVSGGKYVSVLITDRCTWVQRHLLSCKWAHGDVAVLAGEISNLAGLWLGIITRRDLAADVRIKMSRCSCAIAIGGHWPMQSSGSVPPSQGT